MTSMSTLHHNSPDPSIWSKVDELQGILSTNNPVFNLEYQQQLSLHTLRQNFMKQIKSTPSSTTGKSSKADTSLLCPSLSVLHAHLQHAKVDWMEMLSSYKHSTQPSAHESLSFHDLIQICTSLPYQEKKRLETQKKDLEVAIENKKKEERMVSLVL
jgi:hypothetical protein